MTHGQMMKKYMEMRSKNYEFVQITEVINDLQQINARKRLLKAGVKKEDL